MSSFTLEKGMVGIAILNKYNENKPFVLDDFIVVCNPLDLNQKEKSS